MICWQEGNYRIRREELFHIEESYTLIDHRCRNRGDTIGWYPFTYQPNRSGTPCCCCNEIPSEPTQALFWFLVEDSARNYS